MTTVEKRALRNPDGTEFTLDVVHTTTQKGAVVIPVLNERGTKTLFYVEQNRSAIGRRTAEFPRGTTTDLDRGEAMRELLEETGFSPDQVLSVALVGSIFPDTGLLSTEVSVFTAILAPSARGHEFSNGLENDLVLRHGSYHSVIKTVQESGCGISLAALAIAEDRLRNL